MTHPTKQPPPIKPVTPRDTHITQPNETKNATPDTHSLLATLEKFQADQKQTTPPRHRYNPPRGGSPEGGGSPYGDITSSLSLAEQRAVGNSVRRCYTEDTEARNYATFQAHMVVTTDASGVARAVKFSPGDLGRMSADPSFRAFAERAADAVLSPECANLPLPGRVLGAGPQNLNFVFRP